MLPAPPGIAECARGHNACDTANLSLLIRSRPVKLQPRRIAAAAVEALTATYCETISGWQVDACQVGPRDASLVLLVRRCPVLKALIHDVSIPAALLARPGELSVALRAAAGAALSVYLTGATIEHVANGETKASSGRGIWLLETFPALQNFS
jgi:hypothetical protein